jgi:hypothetical protein
MLLVGCSSGTSGQAQPTPTTGTAASSDSHNGAPSSAGATQAPRVVAALDAARLLIDPCAALTSANLAGLHLTSVINSGTHHNADGVQCTWTGESGGSISIGWETVSTNGLSDLYAKSSTIAYWRPSTVSGYPAAYGDILGDNRARGECVINVAVNDRLYFDSDFIDLANAKQSCTRTQQAAADVIENLRHS